MPKLHTSIRRLTNYSLFCLAAALTMAMPGLAETPLLLVVYASGGWDQSLVFDPKVGVASVAQEPGQTVTTLPGGFAYGEHADRPAVHDFFRTYGGRSTIVNGVFVGGMDLLTAQQRLFTVVPKGKSRALDWATLYTDASGFAGDLPHAVMKAPFAPGEALATAVLLNPTTFADYLQPPPSAEAFTSTAEDALKLMRRKAYARQVDTAAVGSLDKDKRTALSESVRRDSSIAKQLQTAAASVGALGSDSAFAYEGKLAVELFAQRASQAVTVQAGGSGLWDTTSANFSRQSAAYQMLFNGLSSILAYAEQKGLLERLTVVVMSEAGRSPQLNRMAGKDLWPYTSMLLWGNSVSKGAVVGSTDELLRSVPVDPVFGGSDKPTSVVLTPANIWSALLLKAGFNPQTLSGDAPPLAQIIK